MEEDIFKVGSKIILKPIPPGERAPNRTFLSLNRIEDRLRPGEASGPEGIMRKDTTTAKLTQREKERNKKIAKKRYIATPGGIRSIDIMMTDNTNYANKLCKVEDIHNTIPPGEKQYFGLSHLHDGFRLDSVLEGLRPGRESLPLGECLQGSVYHHHKKHVGCHVQPDLPCEMRSLFHWGGI